MRGKGVRGRKWSEGEGSVYVCGGERGGWEGEESAVFVCNASVEIKG